MSYLLIGLGSALGGMARYWCSVVIVTAVKSIFPWNILVVNVLGSGLIGVAMGVLEQGGRWQASDATRNFVIQFFMVGVLGGYTTFSSFSAGTLNLLREQQWLQAGANVLLSVTLCLLAVALGFWIASTLNSALNSAALNQTRS